MPASGKGVPAGGQLLTFDLIVGAGVAEQDTGADVGDELPLAAETREVGGAAAGALGGRLETADGAGGELGDEAGERVVGRVAAVGLGGGHGGEEGEGDGGELHDDGS